MITLIMNWDAFSLHHDMYIRSYVMNVTDPIHYRNVYRYQNPHHASYLLIDRGPEYKEYRPAQHTSGRGPGMV